MVSLIHRITSSISEIEERYQDIQGLILTEDDLKCLIYSKLYHYLSERIPTNDPHIHAISLHSELSWYDENEKLRLKPDITILNPSNLSIKHGISVRFDRGHLSYDTLPSKGYSFGGKAILLEIKFEKEVAGITLHTIKKIREDINKIIRLRRRQRMPAYDNSIIGIIILFNKTDKRKSRFDDLAREFSRYRYLNFIYGTGNVVF